MCVCVCVCVCVLHVHRMYVSYVCIYSKYIFEYIYEARKKVFAYPPPPHTHMYIHIYKYIYIEFIYKILYRV